MITLFKNTKLKNIVKIYSGNSINKKIKEKNYTGIENGVDYISTKDIGFNYSINYDNGVKIPFNKIKSFKTAPKNTVFICAEGGSAGRKIAISNRELCFVNKLFAIVVSDKVIPKYIFYSIISQDFFNRFKTQATGIIGGVSINKFKELEILLPPIPIQHKIVEKLDAIFAEIDKATELVDSNVKNAEALFRGFLHKFFLKIDNYNKPIKLSEIIKLEYGKGLKKSDRDLNGIYGAYGANGIKSKTNRYLYDKPSIIIGRKGSAGELTIVTEKFWALDVTYYVTHDDSKTDLYFLYYVLKILNIPSLAKGIKPGINRNNVYDLLITIPKINEQKLIVKNIFAFSNNLNLVIDLLKKKKIELYSLKQSILKQAFNGELVKVA
jgi:type I restriction enzyme S subunit